MSADSELRAANRKLSHLSQNTSRLPEQWAKKLLPELRAVNESAAAALQRALHRAWPAFVYDGGCAFDMFLMELAWRKQPSGVFELVRSCSEPLYSTSFIRSGASLGGTVNTAHHFWSPTRGRFHLPGSSKVGPSFGAGAQPH